MMQKIKTILAITFFMLSLSPVALAGNPEKLLGIVLDFDKQEVTIQVVSSGCTQKKDFSFEMKGDTLTIVRTRRDDCKMVETPSQLTYSLKEAGINPNKPFILRNKLVTSYFTAKIQ